MKMKKSHYIVKSEEGCFGALTTPARLEDRFTNKKLAEKKCNELKKSAPKGTIYWIDFEWV